MLNELFKLNGTPVIHEPGAPLPNFSPGNTVENMEFHHPVWPSPLRKVRDVTFRNVGLSKMSLERLTFNGCTFEDCLFLATRFVEVEFHNCTFRNCTFWKVRFEQVYLNPDSIILCRKYRVEAANTGVSLFHSLLNNFDNARQDQFYARADMLFRRWKRFQLSYDLTQGHIKWWTAHWRSFCSVLYEGLAGFGYRPWRFFWVTIFLFLAMSWVNHAVIGGSLTINGQPGNQASFVDSVYYTFSVLTVLGFSTIMPTTSAAKLLTVAEALAAIGWLAIFTSLLVKRFLR